MSSNLTKLNLPRFSKRLQPKGGILPIAIHTSIQGLPQKSALDAETELARDARLFHHIAALSDVNKKKDIVQPASSTAVSASHIIPQLLDSSPNCGMRIIATDLTDKDLEGDKLQRLLIAASDAIPTQAYTHGKIPIRIIIESFIHGSQPIANYLKVRTEDEIQNTYSKGNMFNAVPKKYRLQNWRQLLQVVPPIIVFFARYRLGILGATGSHFLTLMKVDELLDDPATKALGLSRGQYVFFMHTGSGMIGRYIGYMYSSQRRRLAAKIQLLVAKIGFISTKYHTVDRSIRSQSARNIIPGFATDTPEAIATVQAIQAAANQGFANRTVITHSLDIVLQKITGRQISLRLIYDTPHVLLSRENHYGQDVWVHRNGTARALGKGERADSSTTGEPVLIAPYENASGYIGIALDGNLTTFRSANHELGKKSNTPEATIAQYNKNKSVKEETVMLCQAGDITRVTVDSRHKQFAAAVAAEIEQNRIAKMAAKLKPIGVVTYKR